MTTKRSKEKKSPIKYNNPTGLGFFQPSIQESKNVCFYCRVDGREILVSTILTSIIFFRYAVRWNSCSATTWGRGMMYGAELLLLEEGVAVLFPVFHEQIF